MDFTYLQTLKAKIKSSNCDLLGFLFETILKSFLTNFCWSSDCVKIELPIELNFESGSKEKFEASINLKFFLILSVSRAFLSKPLAIITSRNILFNSKANKLFTLKLHETIPPKALVGSHAKADL